MTGLATAIAGNYQISIQFDHKAMSHKLQWKIFGEGYDEQIELSTSTGQLLFKGNCDVLVTSVRGEIELCLNYGDSQNVYHHVLKVAGNKVVLLPTVHESELSNFWISRSLGAHIFLLEDYVALWSQLRYDTSELFTLFPMDSNDWVLLWLLNIPSVSGSLSISSLKSWVLEKRVAEDPEGYPSVAEILSGQIRATGELTYHSIIEEVVTVYLDCEDLGVVEWRALNAQERGSMLLGNGWTVKAEYTSIS